MGPWQGVQPGKLTCASSCPSRSNTLLSILTLHIVHCRKMHIAGYNALHMAASARHCKSSLTIYIVHFTVDIAVVWYFTPIWFAHLCNTSAILHTCEILAHLCKTFCTLQLLPSITHGLCGHCTALKNLKIYNRCHIIFIKTQPKRWGWTVQTGILIYFWRQHLYSYLVDVWKLFE